MQFESHLGHDVFPRQGRFCFDVCTKLVVASSDGLGGGLWPGRRGAYAGRWGGGFRTLADGPSAFSELVLCVCSFRLCRVGRGCPTPVHGPVLRARHDLSYLVSELRVMRFLVAPAGRY